MRRTGGREEEEEDGADTELKTKTPHVNVGKNCNFIRLEFYKEGYHFIRIFFINWRCTGSGSNYTGIL